MFTEQVDDDELTDGGRDGRTDERTDGQMNGQTDGRTEGRAGGRVGGRTDGRTDIITCVLASFLSCCFLRPYTTRASILAYRSSFRRVSIPAGGVMFKP